MAIEIPGETSSAEELDAQCVANAFLDQYYMILHKSPENLHKFYKDESVVVWPGADGSRTSVTTMQGINDKIMTSDCKGCLVEILYADALESVREGVILAVSGCLIGKDKLRKIFYQTFFLAKQERGYFVLNDIFSFVDEQKSLNPLIVNDTNENTSIAPLANDEPGDVPAQPKPVKASTCTEAMDSGETASKVTNLAAEVPETLVTPNQDMKRDSQKTSYASVVAKESKMTSPTDNSCHRVIRVAATANQLSVASPAPNSGSVTKDQISSNNTSREISNNSNNSVNNNHAEAVISKTIYIQNLPVDITKSELADAVKNFGRVRPGGIQLRTFEDGFCFGFVEFESPTSAKSAVKAHIITVKDYEARISYKKSGSRAGNGARASGTFRTGNFKGQENGEIHAGGGYRGDNQADFVGRSRGFDGQNGEFVQNNSRSRDGRAQGGEAYPRNNWKNDERWSNGEIHHRNAQWRNERGRTEDAYQRNNYRRNERAATEGGLTEDVETR